MIDYTLGIKNELLQAVVANELPCCRQSFIAGLLRGSRHRPHVRVRLKLRARMCRCLQNLLPNQLIETAGTWIFLPGLDLGYLRQKFVDRIRIISDSKSARHCLIAFMQGLFVAHGYVQKPDRGYHLEFRLRGRWPVAAFRKISTLLKQKFGWYEHEKQQSFYMKSGRRITRLLNLLGLFDRSMEFADLRATRNLLSIVNRQVNSETANINRLISAAESSINHIRELLTYEDQEIWTESLHQLAQMRLKFPHDSIEALGKRFEPPLSKSAVNHRLRRIKALHARVFSPGGVKDQPA